MTDIVARLRDAPWLENGALCQEAAAEITRLRAELATARDAALEEAAAKCNEHMRERLEIRSRHPLTSREWLKHAANAEAYAWAAAAIRAMKGAA